VKPNLLILFSGGADSSLILEMALDIGFTPHCILIDYDQNQKIELDFAERYLNEKSIPFQTVELHGLGLISGLTTGEKSLYDGVNEMYVPARNLMFVSIAASIAENMNIKTIWYGANFTDMLEGFPDCTTRWIEQINNLLEFNGSFPIRLEAPLWHMTKDLVVKKLDERGVDMTKIFSGYLEDNKSSILDWGDDEIEPGLWSRFKT